MENSTLLQLLARVDSFQELVTLYIEAKTGDQLDLSENFPSEVLKSFEGVDALIDDHNTRGLINRKEPDLI